MPEVEKRNSCQFFVMRCYFFRTSHFDGLRPASSGQVVNYRCSLPRTQLLCRSILASRCYCQIPPIIQSYVLLSLVARGGKVENGFPRRKYLSPDQARGGHAKGCFFSQRHFLRKHHPLWISRCVHKLSSSIQKLDQNHKRKFLLPDAPLSKSVIFRKFPSC